MAIRTRRGLTLLLLAAGVLGTAPASAAEFKLAVFDPQRVSEETAIGKRVQAELTVLRDRKQSAITEQEQAIAELQRKLSQQELSLSSDRRSTMEREIQSRIMQLQSNREVATRELQMEVAAAQSNFEDKLLAVVQAYSKEQGLTLVLARDLVAWADGSIDVTDGIIEHFNQMFPATESEAAESP